MLSTLIALVEAAEAAKDYDESLGAVAWIFVGAALLVAVIATWIITPKGDGHH